MYYNAYSSTRGKGMSCRLRWVSTCYLSFPSPSLLFVNTHRNCYRSNKIKVKGKTFKLGTLSALNDVKSQRLRSYKVEEILFELSMSLQLFFQFLWDCCSRRHLEGALEIKFINAYVHGESVAGRSTRMISRTMTTPRMIKTRDYSGEQAL